ncbi:MAG: PhzF family phenazine biosynthesis protein [Rubripirellula sp.]|jgi:PhzF family phenazine biosynthesis protein
MKQDLIRYFVVDAFTDRPFGGNPAAVVLLSEWPDDTWLQNIAMEMNLSETAFLVPNRAGFDLRWFTPTVEVDLCGHATLASASAILHTGLQADKSDIEFSTRSGVLYASLNGDRIQLDFPLKPESPTIPPVDLLEGLSVTPAYVGRNEYDYLVEVETERELRSLTPNFDQLARLDCRGIIVTSPSTDPEFDFLSRFFGPAVGVNEDPVTGSAHCCLAHYWQKRTGLDRFTAFQASQRGGVVHLTVRQNRVLMAGNAIIVAQGELLVCRDR